LRFAAQSFVVGLDLFILYQKLKILFFAKI
jgi:hypothetical protein